MHPLTVKQQDPLFQRMAALYEHIGDLVALGDVDATTKAYQEVGISIWLLWDYTLESSGALGI